MERRGSIAINVVIIIVLGLLVLVILSVILSGNFRNLSQTTNELSKCESLGGECELVFAETCPAGRDKVPDNLCETDDDRVPVPENAICCFLPS